MADRIDVVAATPCDSSITSKRTSKLLNIGNLDATRPVHRHIHSLPYWQPDLFHLHGNSAYGRRNLTSFGILRLPYAERAP